MYSRLQVIAIIELNIVVFGFLSHILKRAGLVGFHCKYTEAEESKVPDICEQQTK